MATQTPPIRSGRRVIFLTLDDATGPVDATFFEDVQGPYASTVFGSWLLVVRGAYAGPGGGASPCARPGPGTSACSPTGGAPAGSTRQLAEIDRVPETVAELNPGPAAQRVLVHSSGFRMSPYADIKPAGQSPGQVTGEVARKLWHRSPGSTG